MNNHLHIISLDVPWPADYGGVVDILYKIIALHEAGIKIHLHCFTKGRAPQPELNKYCETVHYYPRQTSFSALSFTTPYIVSSRKNKSLLQNIAHDDHPILMEGMHCTSPVFLHMFSNRKMFVRLHNVEFQYYRKLALHEKSFLKKIYFLAESFLLKRYEKKVAGKAALIAISEKDASVFKALCGNADVSTIPAFHPWQQMPDLKDKGCFCLYHGNLSVNENEKAATWLLTEVFNNGNIPFVVAGKNPSKKLQELAHRGNNTCLVANPSEGELQDLVKKAQINVLPSFNETGVKLKLINALYNGRHCLANELMSSGNGLAGVCHTALDKTDFRKKVAELYALPFSAEEQLTRKAALDQLYNNQKNAQELINLLY